MKKIVVALLFSLLFTGMVRANPFPGLSSVNWQTIFRFYSGNLAQRNPNCQAGDAYYGVDTVLLYICTANNTWGTGVSPSPSAGTGTVSTVSVATANGFAGTVANPTTTPAITVQTSITGVLKGNGTAISAATAGTDYSTPSATETLTNKTFDTAGTGNSFSINGVAATANTGTGSLVRATSPVFGTTINLHGTASTDVELKQSTSVFNVRAGDDSDFLSASALNWTIPINSAATDASVRIDRTGSKFGSAMLACFSSTTSAFGSLDICTARNAAGVLEFDNGTQGTLADWTARASTLSSATAPITFSNAAYHSCTALTTNSSGVLGCTASDERLKQGFGNFSNGLSIIKKITPQTYRWKASTSYADGDKVHLGLIAQDLQRANPLLVSATGAGVLGPEPMALHAVEIDAIKTLDAKIEALTKIVAAQEKEIARLRRARTAK